MRAMPIRIVTGKAGLIQMKASFTKNWKHYLQEALGLAMFMISACFFGALLEGKEALLHHAIHNNFLRTAIMGLMMGATALFIFYSPFTSPSGSHINPAVTLAFLHLGKICHWDAVFYILFQFAGGTAAVYLMQWLIGPSLTDAPVHSVVTIPGRYGIVPAMLVEFAIAFITMTMVLFTSAHKTLKNYTRWMAGCLVCLYVILAGPVSGFGMNPARSFAAAVPAHIYTAFWIYILVPVAGMLCASYIFKKWNKTTQMPAESSVKEINRLFNPMYNI